jgi:hypothetical protein
MKRQHFFPQVLPDVSGGGIAGDCYMIADGI